MLDGDPSQDRREAFRFAPVFLRSFILHFVAALARDQAWHVVVGSATRAR
jgi:hypothetical protein